MNPAPPAPEALPVPGAWRRRWLWRWVIVATGMAGALLPLSAQEEDDGEEPGVEEIVTARPAADLFPALKTAEPVKSVAAPVATPVPAPPTPSATPAPTPAETPQSQPAEASQTPPENPPQDPTPNAQPPTAAGRPLPFRSVIHSVDPSAPLFTMGKKKIRVVRVTTATRFTRVDGQPATFDMLEPGLEVRGSARKLAQSEWEAISVSIGSKAAAATATLED